MAAQPLIPEALKPEKYRSFTVRIPQNLYVEISSLAQNEDLHLNKKVNQLLNLGMGHHIELDKLLLRLVKRSLSQEMNDE